MDHDEEKSIVRKEERDIIVHTIGMDNERTVKKRKTEDITDSIVDNSKVSKIDIGKDIGGAVYQAVLGTAGAESPL